MSCRSRFFFIAVEEKACGEDRNGNEEYAGCYAIERFAADGVKQNAAEQVAENAGDLRHGNEQAVRRGANLRHSRQPARRRSV